MSTRIRTMSTRVVSRAFHSASTLSSRRVVLDVTDEAAVDATIPVIEQEVGPIDSRGNNAGSSRRVPIREMVQCAHGDHGDKAGICKRKLGGVALQELCPRAVTVEGNI